MVKSRIFLSEVVDIKNSVSGETQRCYQAWIHYKGGGFAPVLLTYEMIDAAKKIAIDNPGETEKFEI